MELPWKEIANEFLVTVEREMDNTLQRIKNSFITNGMQMPEGFKPYLLGALNDR